MFFIKSTTACWDLEIRDENQPNYLISISAKRVVAWSHGDIQCKCKEVRARFCKRLTRPGIDSKVSIPPAYVAWRAGTTNRVVVPARQAEN